MSSETVGEDDKTKLREIPSIEENKSLFTPIKETTKQIYVLQEQYAGGKGSPHGFLRFLHNVARLNVC